MQTLQASCEDPRRFFTLFPTTSVSFFSHITSNELLLSDGLNKLLMQDFMLMYSILKFTWQTWQTLLQFFFFAQRCLGFTNNRFCFFLEKKVHETLERPSHRECLAKVLDWMLSNNYTFHNHLIFAHQLGGSSVKTIASLEALPFSPSSRVLRPLISPNSPFPSPLNAYHAGYYASSKGLSKHTLKQRA